MEAPTLDLLKVKEAAAMLAAEPTPAMADGSRQPDPLCHADRTPHFEAAQEGVPGVDTSRKPFEPKKKPLVVWQTTRGSDPSPC